MDNIIYGKAQLKKVVSIEPGDGCIEIFYENKPGQITSEVRLFNYWLLSNKSFDSGYIRLNGNLYYKWGRQFSTYEEWLSHRKSHGWKNFFSPSDAKEQAAIKNGYSTLLDMHPKDVSVLSFDIETTGLDPHKQDAQILLISTAYRVSDKIEKRLFSYDEFNSPKEMIESFCAYVREKNPSFLIGHNIISFDLNYLHVMANKYGTSLSLGRDGRPAMLDSYERKFRVDGNRDLHYHNFHIYGREIIDSYFLSIKSDISRKYHSYGLKAIIEQEGLIIPGRTFYDASKIRTNYLDPNEWSLIKKYCEDDALDSLTLYDKFIPPFFYLTQSVPKSLQSVILSASGSQINSVLVRAYLQDGHSIPNADEIQNFQGGISFGLPGIYKNVWKIDIRSSYPTAIISKKLYDEKKDPNGYMLYLCEFFTKKRIEYKKLYKETKDEKYLALDQSSKIFINSIFGFCSANGLNFNSPHIAAEITKTGREFLNEGTVWATNKNIEEWIPNEET